MTTAISPSHFPYPTGALRPVAATITWTVGAPELPGTHSMDLYLRMRSGSIPIKATSVADAIKAVQSLASREDAANTYAIHEYSGSGFTAIAVDRIQNTRSGPVEWAFDLGNVLGDKALVSQSLTSSDPSFRALASEKFALAQG